LPGLTRAQQVGYLAQRLRGLVLCVLAFRESIDDGQLARRQIGGDGRAMDLVAAQALLSVVHGVKKRVQGHRRELPGAKAAKRPREFKIGEKERRVGYERRWLGSGRAVPASTPFDSMPGVGRIAVLHANGLGDFVFSLPALYALKVTYPTAELTLLGSPWHARALSGRPGPIDYVAVVPAVPGIRDGDSQPGELDAFRRWAAGEGFDVALQMHGCGRVSNPFVATLGARLTAGMRTADAPPLDRWIPYVHHQPEVSRYLEVAGLVGAAAVTHRPVFELTDDDRAQAVAAVGSVDRPRVVLHPGAADPRRRWPADRFAAVGDALAATGAEIVVTGTAAQRGLVEAVRAGMRHPARPVVDELTVSGLAGLLADSALVVAGDSGPLHLAAAVGTRTVGLFWIGNVINRAADERGRHRPLISWTIHCPECGIDCTRSLYPARGRGGGCRHTSSFVADIPVAEVKAEALELLAAYREEARPARVAVAA
jgi:ADP-heptose:LPS heptosyltransferase